jgi:hypothetical protein
MPNENNPQDPKNAKNNASNQQFTEKLAGDSAKKQFVPVTEIMSKLKLSKAECMDRIRGLGLHYHNKPGMGGWGISSNDYLKLRRNVNPKLAENEEADTRRDRRDRMR